MPLAAALPPAAPFLYLRREPPPHPLNLLNLMNLLNPGHPVAPMGDTITLGPKGRSNLRPKACQPLDPPVHQNAGISPSLKLSLMYFFTASLWKIFTNF